MKAEELIGLQIVDVSLGTTLGETSGLLIDQHKKKVVALQVGGGTFSRPRYIDYAAIESVEHDVVTVPSTDYLVDRSDFKAAGLTDHITDRRVVTDDGKELGNVQSYSIDPKTGDITSVTFGADRASLGGLRKSPGDRYDVPGRFIRTLGEVVVVDRSVPDMLGFRRAA